MRRSLREAFAQAGYRVVVAGSTLEVLEAAQRENPDLILLDAAAPQIDSIPLCRRLRQNPRTARRLVVMLIPRESVEDKLAAFHAGADDCLAAPFDTRELLARAQAMLGLARRLRVEAASRTGKLIAFMSAKGGVGTSTICVNVAAALASFEIGPVTVVDLVLPLGCVSHFVGLETRTTLADLAHQDVRELTRTQVEGLLFTRAELGFHVLVGARTPREAQEVSPGHVEPLFRLLRDIAAFTLVDVGRTLSRISLPVITGADLVVMVLSPNPSTLLMTKTYLGFLEGLQVPRQRIALVMSLTAGREALTKQQAEDYLQTAIHCVVPNEGDRFSSAASQGVPLLQKEPGCVASLQLLDLARYVSSAV